MDNSIKTLLGAVGALAAAVPAHAATSAPMTLESAMRADSYADLLKPIPNAVALRDELAASQVAGPVGAEVLSVQYYHHHHHRYYHRRFYHHHHHHHFYHRRGVRVGPVIIR